MNEEPWFGVKCIFLHHHAPKRGEGSVYEERIVLVRAESADEAVRLGEAEAQEYAGANDAEYLGFIDTFRCFAGELEAGVEVYSLMRTSPLDPEAFVTRYFDDGTQHAKSIDDDGQTT